MSKLRKVALQGAFVVLVAVVLWVSVLVLVSEIPFHRFKAISAQVRDRNEELTENQVAAQWERLEKTLGRYPKNAKAQFEMGRMLHRLAADPDRALQICQMRNFDEKNCDFGKLLKTSIDHYDRAIFLNRLIGSARFWKLAAMVRLQEMSAQNEVTLSSDEILDELRLAMEYEGTDPILFKSAGDLAAKAGDEQLASYYYGESLKRSLQALEPIVNRVALFKLGFDALEGIVPATPKAYERASEALVDQWRFDIARFYWNQAKSWQNKATVKDNTDNLVANGRFIDPPGSHFLGWEIQKRSGVKIKNTPGKPGIEFNLTHAPKHYFHFLQKIPVEPEVTYHFSCKFNMRDRLRKGSAIGFEVIHPYDFSIWSAGARCVIDDENGHPVCKNQIPDEDGNQMIEFDFTPPMPLRMIVLRLVWTNNPKSGIIQIDQVRIEKKMLPVESEDAPSP